MKKLLIRGAVSPYTSISPAEAMVHDPTGSNSGNLLYAYGITHILQCAGYECAFDGYAAELGKLKDADIQRINQEYDSYIIPLADAFRKDYANKLLNLASVVDRLTIPCIVVGAGLRAEYEPDIEGPHSFDEAAKRFITSVLSKSSMVGLRGAITERYLDRLGFVCGSQHEAIGCPSMYAFGANIDVRESHLYDDANIAFTQSGIVSPTVTKILADGAKRYPSSRLIIQNYPDLQRAYYGCEIFSESGIVPWRFMYHEGRVLGFVRALPWIDYLRTADFCVGGKLHGGVAGYLAGTPTLVIPADARTRELAEFHEMPSIPSCEIGEEESLESLFERTDFRSHLRHHQDHFEHYLDFLRINGLDIPPAPELNKLLVPEHEEVSKGCITTIYSVSSDEATARHVNYIKHVRADISALNTELTSQKKAVHDLKVQCNALLAERKTLADECSALKARLDHSEAQLNRRCARISLHAADMVGGVFRAGKRLIGR